MAKFKVAVIIGSNRRESVNRSWRTRSPGSARTNLPLVSSNR